MAVKPHIQKLPLSEHSSFVARTYRTPHFEVGWHKHTEYELILFTEGSGLSFVGHHIGQFQAGDIYLLGSNLPHTFQKQGEQVTSAVVVQFLPHAFGADFFKLPESNQIGRLLESSGSGLRIQVEILPFLRDNISQMEKQKGMPRLLNLLSCLDQIAQAHAFQPLNLQPLSDTANHDTRIDEIFRYSITNYRDRITLDNVAALVHMSIPAFCAWFKKVTKKTYIEFLNEIRISSACDLLTNTLEPISAIAYTCGFSHAGHFHRQFLRHKSHSPLQYRKIYSNTDSYPNIHAAVFRE